MQAALACPASDFIVAAVATSTMLQPWICGCGLRTSYVHVLLAASCMYSSGQSCGKSIYHGAYSSRHSLVLVMCSIAGLSSKVFSTGFVPGAA